jgi:UMF1 family MFS transporter
MSLRSFFQNHKPIIGWLLYDIASSSYILLIPSIAYAIYYRQVVCGSTPGCDAQWGMLTALALIFAGGLSPMIGAIADLGHLRYRFFAITTFMCCLGTALLYWVQPGARLWGGLAFVVAQVGYILSASLYDSYLPTLAPPQRLGQLSSLGWGLGYLGGVGCFFIVQPWLSHGLTPENLPLYRLTFLAVAGFYGLEALPALAWIPRESPRALKTSPQRIATLARRAYQQVTST